MDKARNNIHAALVPVFLLALWVPALCGLVGFDPVSRPNENRNPSASPGVPDSLAALQAFPQKFEAYYNDHFGLRNTLVYTYLWTKCIVLGASPAPMTVVGKGDWTYLGHDQQLAASRGTAPLSEVQLEQLRKRFEGEKAIAERYGARYLRCYGPDKTSIYPEYAPAWLRNARGISNLGQMQDYIDANSDVAMLDLRPALLKAKADYGLVYLQSNSHWNSVGAYAAYFEIAQAIRPWFPNFSPVLLKDLKIEWRPRKPTDPEAEIDIDYYKVSQFLDARPVTWHSRTVGDKIEGLDLGPEYKVSVSENTNPFLPKLVVFHDSFVYAMSPFLTESFSRVVLVRQPSYSEEIIAHEKPDLVLCLNVERKLTPVFADSRD